MKFSITFLIVLISGCSALEQAPLFYTSTVSLGVNTGVNTTEAPGLSLSLGYKQVDAAYVPVAVAKSNKKNEKIESVQNANQENVQNSSDDMSVFQIVPIQALNSGSNLHRSQASEVQIQELKSFQSKIEEKKTLERAPRVVLLSESRAKYDEANQQIENSESTEVTDELQEIADQASATIQKFEQEITEIDKEITKLETDYNRLKNDIGMTDEINGSDNKYDAYSVYGSFDSKTTVFGSANASSDTGLGKVFSTGVAAQILAESEYKKASVVAVTACLKQLKELVGKDVTVSEQTLKVCQANESKNSAL